MYAITNNQSMMSRSWIIFIYEYNTIKIGNETFPLLDVYLLRIFSKKNIWLEYPATRTCLDLHFDLHADPGHPLVVIPPYQSLFFFQSLSIGKTTPDSRMSPTPSLSLWQEYEQAGNFHLQIITITLSLLLQKTKPGGAYARWYAKIRMDIIPFKYSAILWVFLTSPKTIKTHLISMELFFFWKGRKSNCRFNRLNQGYQLEKCRIHFVDSFP